MDLADGNEYLSEFLGVRQPPRLSLYQPTFRRHPENQQDPVKSYLLLEKWRRDAVGCAGAVRCRNSDRAGKLPRVRHLGLQRFFDDQPHRVAQQGALVEITTRYLRNPFAGPLARRYSSHRDAPLGLVGSNACHSVQFGRMHPPPSLFQQV